MYSIKIEWYATYECVISLYAYLHEKEQKYARLGTAWKKETALMLPAAFAKELEDERWEVLHRLVLLIAQSPAKESVEGFLAWLEQIPAGEIYERLAPWVDTIPLNLGELRDHSLSLLARWNEHYFAKLDPALLERLQKSADELAGKAADVSPPELVDEATQGIWIEPMADLQQVVLIPQYHCAPASVLDFHRGLATCLYPVADADRRQADPLLALLPVTQCLADEKRLLLLQYLAQKPGTLTELQQHVGLAKSTVHHHITALRRAGLIRAHYAGSTAISAYSLRESGIERLPTLLREFLHESRK
ncbi:ArsR/SmtB family transcription factor [Brevibacillus sp. GCM10020057]|uniref:ArsR/SmtB family transcription factor n=1 Tax=Brevibacillus sp. GCM10020057 TaxID=3317327 RepID=UPI0036250EB4